MRITDFLDARHPFPSLEIIPPQSGIVKDELLDNIELITRTLYGLKEESE